MAILTFIAAINNDFCNTTEAVLMSQIESLCGLENYRPNLEFIKNFLGDKIQQIQNQSKIVVIGGTNGKGETTHCLRQLCYEDEKNVAMWTSPHVLSIRERFIHNDSPISYSKLTELVARVSQDLGQTRLSYYEFLLCVFLYWAQELNVEIILLEVGLGGRFDGVNLFNNPLTVITSISRDHTKILGNNLKDILNEKYGITRNGGELISGIDQDYLKDLLKQWCHRDNITLDFVESLNYRESNQKMAALAFEKLWNKDAKIPITWEVTKGRFEVIVHGGVEFCFVGAHNIDGHRKLLELLNKKGQNTCDGKNLDYGQCVLSFSTGREDQALDIINLYKQYPCVFKKIILTYFKDQRAMDKNFIKSLQTEDGRIEFIEEWNKIFNGSYKKVFITGSYYFIGALQRHLFSI